ncbi:transketolase family protein [Kibdelosporangium persicum]|uniref:Transketolase central region n=1 Tax=Kibdelosporangium persicum TaxID=2698649 RepID=A0ABX2FK37_9PSEU|nr:transketolase C-terminal domain-containing protein [Kibdelosporangium persicum]NRN71100.1 Transketolase central region [Kibdelosporangium persicum]
MTWAERYAGSTREVYRRTLLELACADSRIYCVDSDMGGFEDDFGEQLPRQYANVGIAEANMIGMSAGLAAAGLIPFANTMSAFATARAAEQLRLDVAGNDLPVRIVASHGGLSAGHYGPSHHSLADLAVLRTMPHLTVLVPADTVETEYAIRAAAVAPGPVFVRLGRSETPLVYQKPYEFTVGKAVELAAGNAVTIIATGPLPVNMSLTASALLEPEGIAARVLNMHTIQPIDHAAVVRAARQTAGIVTVEDHVVSGGLGAAVCEIVCAEHPCRVTRMGSATAYVDEVGSERELLVAAGVSPERIAAAAAELANPRWRRETA